MLGTIGGGLATAVVLDAIGYLVPTTAAPEAIAAISGDATVRVDSSPTRIVLTPTTTPRAGLVFLPGGKSTRGPTCRSCGRSAPRAPSS